jgi:hypothetical protein
MNRSFSALSLLALALFGGGCGPQMNPPLTSEPGNGGPIPGTGLGMTGGPGTGGGGGSGGAATGTAYLRVAHLSADAGALDLCVRATGTMGWPGGLAFKPLQSTGLAYPGVSNYVAVPAGVSLDLRAAVAGTDCTTPNRLVDASAVGPFLDGKYYTAGAIGLKAASTTPLVLDVFKDDVVADPANAKLRFIHAAPGLPGPVDVVTESLRGDAAATTLFATVAYGQIASPSSAGNGALSVKGYASLPSPPAALGVRSDENGAPTTQDGIYYAGPALSPGGTYTIYSIGIATPHALLCTDTASLASATFAAACVKSP